MTHDNRTLAEVADAYLDGAVDSLLTAKSHRAAFNRAIKLFGASVTVASLAADAVEQFGQHVVDQGLSQATARRYVAAFGSLLRWAADPSAKPERREYTDEIIRTAAELLATGKTKAQIAELLQVPFTTVRAWPQKHKALWRSAYDGAMEKLTAIVRAEAGTSAVLNDPDAYILRAQNCQRWAKSRGEELFPTDGRMTLRVFYESHYKPVRLGDASELTIKWHYIALGRWEVLTGNPALEDVTPIVLANFRDAMARMRGRKAVSLMSNCTVRSKLSFIQTLLDKAGPSGFRNRDAVGLLANVPWVKPPRKLLKPPRVASGDLLGLLYEAAVAMEFPKIDGFKPPAWWRALLTVAYNTGLRRGTLFSLKMRHIDWNARLLVIPPEIVKTSRGLAIPLNDVAYRHLLAIRTDRELVFPWPRGGRHNFYDKFHALQKAAGIPREQHIGLHAIRKATATVLWETSPAAAQLTLGHTTMATTQNHYVAGAELIARALNAMPQPAAFTAGLAGGAR